MAKQTAKAPRKKPEPKQPEQEIIEFPEGIKRKIITLLQQAQVIQNQMVDTIDTFMDAKEIEDKETWKFDNQGVTLFRDKK